MVRASGRHLSLKKVGQQSIPEGRWFESSIRRQLTDTNVAQLKSARLKLRAEPMGSRARSAPCKGSQQWLRQLKTTKYEMSEVILSEGQKDALVDRLEWKEVRFCHEFLIDQDEFEAAKRAGFDEEIAHDKSRALLKNTQVLMLISTLAGEKGIMLKMAQEDDIAEETEIDTNWIMVRLAKLADYNCQVIKEETITKSGSVITRRKMRDPQNALKALELLGKTKGLYKDKVEHTVDKDLATEIRKARERAGLKHVTLEGEVLDGAK